MLAGRRFVIFRLASKEEGISVRCPCLRAPPDSSFISRFGVCTSGKGKKKKIALVPASGACRTAGRTPQYESEITVQKRLGLRKLFSVNI